jgi:hypothetical protein
VFDAPTAARPPARDANIESEEGEAGDALPPVLQQQMEGLLDVPLREVRVFRNVVSQRLTQAGHADAVTLGNEVHLASGEGDPATPSGRALLAHELAHYAAAVGRDSDARRSPVEEEAQARQVEAAFLEQPNLAPARPALEYRTQPSPVVVPTSVTGPAEAAVGFAPFPSLSPSGAAEASSAIPAAPVDRLLGLAGPGPQTGLAESAGYGLPAQPDEPNREEEEASLVERVVESVLRRIRREAAFDRERRAPFHSDIGG